MRKRHPAAAAAALAFLAAAPAKAEFAVDGKVLRCVAFGQPVRTIESRSLRTPAHSDVVHGRRVIVVNPLLLRRFPPLVQMFFYAHECGHQLQAPNLGAALNESRNPNREKIADRIGIRLMRDQLHLSLEDAEKIAAALRELPGKPPVYLPGPERAKWIIACFRSNNDACTSAPDRGGRHVAAPSLSRPGKPSQALTVELAGRRRALLMAGAETRIGTIP